MKELLLAKASECNQLVEDNLKLATENRVLIDANIDFENRIQLLQRSQDDLSHMHNESQMFNQELKSILLKLQNELDVLRQNLVTKETENNQLVEGKQRSDHEHDKLIADYMVLRDAKMELEGYVKALNEHNQNPKKASQQVKDEYNHVMAELKEIQCKYVELNDWKANHTIELNDLNERYKAVIKEKTSLLTQIDLERRLRPIPKLS